MAYKKVKKGFGTATTNKLTLASVGGESGLTRNVIFSSLAKSPHGELMEYVEVGQAAARREPEFFAHLISWNAIKGAIRDAKVALPMIALTQPSYVKESEFKENALAHFVKLGPRELEKALRFAFALKVPGRGRTLINLVRRYLQARERNWGTWERTAIQHRTTLANLYALSHLKPKAPRMGKILFEGEAPAGTLFEAVRELKNMSPLEAAGTIAEKRIPFLIASGALGAKMKDTDLLLALINRMTPVELVTNATMLERFGVKTNPALRAAWEEKLEKASKSKRSVLKTGHQAAKVKDEGMKAQLNALQEKQLSTLGVKGNWLIACDKSGSMSEAIEVGRFVAATLAKMAEGKVHIVFFDTVPNRVFDVTGLTLERIQSDTRHVSADGGTSIGCSLQYALDRGFEADGIAVVSDAHENTPPFFAERYRAYATKQGKDVPVYLYRVAGSMGYTDTDLADSMKRNGIDLQEFDLRGQRIDYYSILNLVQTMRTNRYSLSEEVLQVPLITLDDAFRKLEKEIDEIALPDLEEVEVEGGGKEVSHA
jgi:hypothetical protein